jgi:hypothetical protein
MASDIASTSNSFSDRRMPGSVSGFGSSLRLRGAAPMSAR